MLCPSVKAEVDFLTKLNQRTYTYNCTNLWEYEKKKTQNYQNLFVQTKLKLFSV